MGTFYKTRVFHLATSIGNVPGGPGPFGAETNTAYFHRIIVRDRDLACSMETSSLLFWHTEWTWGQNHDKLTTVNN